MAVDLKNVLGQIKADCCDFHWVDPLTSSSSQVHYGALHRRMMQEPSTPSAHQRFSSKNAVSSMNGRSGDAETRHVCGAERQLRAGHVVQFNLRNRLYWNDC
jgi:hypothetical protein